MYAWIAMGLLGLVVGSFMNVAIYRLPRMLALEEKAVQSNFADIETAASLNLAWPASHCPQCRHPIAWYDNIPLLSFFLLRRCCRHCQAAISWRYPLVELLTSVIFVACAYGWGLSAPALAWALFASILLALAVIDAQTSWLPDDLTQPLVWMGLIAAAWQWTWVSLPDALAGAVLGYSSLWSINMLYRLVAGRDGIGYGDFKLLAALCAWLGWQAWPWVLLWASLSGLLVGLWQKRRGRLLSGQPMAFGPFLVLAGWLMMIFQYVTEGHLYA